MIGGPSPLESYLGALLSVENALVLFLIALLVGVAGGLVGHMSRKMLILIGFGVLTLLFFTYHTLLPLPDAIDAEIISFKARLLPW